jgi:hypothetical protein
LRAFRLPGFARFRSKGIRVVEYSVATERLADVRVTLVLPAGREYIWANGESAVANWQVGEVVMFRNGRWLVVARDTEQEGLTVTLRPAI